MLILLHGPDTYRSRQKLREIVQEHRKLHRSGLSLKYFDAEEDDLEELLDWLKSTSMFRGKKLAILENAAKLVSHFKEFVKPEPIIIFLEKEFVRGKFPADKEQKFEFLKGVELQKWVKNEFEKLGAQAQSSAMEKLIQFVGSDTWRLSNEIKKLAAYKRNVEARDVALLTRPKIETDIFKTIDAVALKNKKQALKLLQKHLEKGDSPLYLLSMINYQFRNLLLVKASRSVKLKFHPWVGRKLAEQARRFSLGELKRIYRKIFETDFNIKTGKLDPETALELLIAEI